MVTTQVGVVSAYPPWSGSSVSSTMRLGGVNLLTPEKMNVCCFYVQLLNYELEMSGHDIWGEGVEFIGKLEIINILFF